MTLALIDYGAGNLHSVANALKAAGATDVAITADPDVVARADRVVLPGVGSFKSCAQGLNAIDGLVQAMEARVLGDKVPFLGICVGMQVMFDASEEMGEHAGLGLLPGRVRAVPAVGTGGKPHRIPHIGWRPLEPSGPWDGTILANVQPRERVYFVHSFAADPSHEAMRLAHADYDGVAICASVHRDNLYGCQFHPERSAETGLNVLRRFLKL